MINKAIFTILSEGDTLAGDRIYPEIIPQNINETCVRYTEIVRNIVRTFNKEDNGHESLFQIDCFSRKKTDAQALATEISDILEGYAGAVGDVTILSTLLENAARSDYDEETKDFIVMLEIRCRWW
jgi:hypothetical protein